ncbi:MAG: HutD family protein [Rubrivivax sp.]|nr:HutD family protein [Rubrivivax sp.]
MSRNDPRAQHPPASARPRRPPLKRIRLAGVTPMPWKNGGGMTRELLRWPASGEWQLRVSVAEIVRSGPFSAYPGVARWFCVLQGPGVMLQMDADAQGLSLTPDSPPLHFDGALAPVCTLLGGPTLDLNLMARQDSGRAELTRAVAGVPWASRAPLRALFTLQATTLRGAGPRARTLAAGTLAVSTDGDGAAWHLDDTGGGPVAAWWLAYEPHAR